MTDLGLRFNIMQLYHITKLQNLFASTANVRQAIKINIITSILKVESLVKVNLFSDGVVTFLHDI